MEANAADLPPYEPERILNAPFPERVRLVCRTWASQVNPNPFVVTAMYWIKYFTLYIGVWMFFVSFNAGYPGFTSPGDWAFTADAFQKAMLWSLAYEIIGLGCSSGPMNARFIPPIGGVLYFLRPGTTKLPLFPGVPIIGGITRSWLDVTLNAANLALLLRALLAPEVTPALLLPPLVLIAVLGVLDKTIFLAARGEHYWVVLVGLYFAAGNGPWISAAKCVWLCIWFWAATSKVSPLFPSVIQVMMNNGPFFPRWLKLPLFADYPDDLRPSKMAEWMAHFGTMAEYAIPIVLVLAAGNPTLTMLGLIFMAGFHAFITMNNPSGMPLEWNILMIYGGFFLFWFHPEAGPTDVLSMPALAAFIFFCSVCIPAFGNFVPSRVSFLLSMRYYAGNWAYNIYFFKPSGIEKLDRLKKSAGTMRQQLSKMLDEEQQVDVAIALAMSHRYMHLEGRPLLEAVPKAVDDIDEYEWIEGEVLGGSLIGWNFGDGHLNGTQLLEAMQAQCDFEEGEVRAVMVESLPLFGKTMRWKIVDAKAGVLEEGETEIRPLKAVQPYPTGAYAEAFGRASSSATGSS